MKLTDEDDNKQTSIFDVQDTNELIKIFNSLDDDDKERKKPDEQIKNIDETSRKWEMNDKVTELFEKSIYSDIKLKGKYGLILVIMLGLQLLFFNVIFVLRGLNVIKYSDAVFNVFISGSLIEIFGLVMVIVKYLFKDNLSESLQIILKSANFKNKNQK